MIKRVRKILSTKLSAKNEILVINIWALTAYMYIDGVLSWSKADLKRLDRRNRNALRQSVILPPKSAIERIYLPRNKGGRGLVNIENSYQKKQQKLRKSFFRGNSPLPRLASALHLSQLTSQDRSTKPYKPIRIVETKLAMKTTSWTILCKPSSTRGRRIELNNIPTTSIPFPTDRRNNIGHTRPSGANKSLRKTYNETER